tara:strand:- start:185 stop:787 length:603 start_codon:yes stop_codon:yes gene_type:complete
MNPEKIRKVYAPYSTTGEQVGQTPLTGYVDVAQAIYPAVNTGQVSVDGEWSGVVVSDKSFLIDPTHNAVANGADVLSPQKADHEYIDMTGYNTIFLAINPSNAGDYALAAVMAPQQYPFANLTPVNANGLLKGLINSDTTSSNNQNMNNLYVDTAETLVADVWNIFMIESRLANQKVLQFRITNNSGGNSNIQFATLRVV